MPGPAIRIELGIGGCRQRPMRGAPIIGGCRPVDGRTQKRMAKRDLGAQFEQPVSLGWSQLIDRDVDLLRGANEERGLPGRVGRGQEQQPLGLGSAAAAPAAGSSLRSGLATIRR